MTAAEPQSTNRRSRASGLRSRLAVALLAALMGLATAAPAALAPASAQEGAQDDIEDFFPKRAELVLTDCGGKGSVRCDPPPPGNSEPPEGEEYGKPWSFTAPPNGVYVDHRRARRDLFVVQSSNSTGMPRGIATIDLDTRRQTAMLELPLPHESNACAEAEPNCVTSPNLVDKRPYAYESRRRRLLWGSKINQDRADCGKPSNVTSRSCIASPAETDIVAVDVDDGSSEKFTFPSDYGGHRVAGMAYDPTVDAIYAVTYTGTGSEQAVAGQSTVDARFNVHEIDAATLTLNWSRRLTMCLSPIEQQAYGQAIGYGRDESGRYLYLACEGAAPSGSELGDLQVAVGAPSQYTLTGVVRLNLPEKPADQSTSPAPQPVATRTDIDPRDIEAEFYPFAGDLAKGFSVDDPVSKRLSIVVSGAGKQRIYVFDAARRAWVGSVPLVSERVANFRVFGLALDVLAGRLYVLDLYDDTSIAFSAMDTVALPVSQGARLQEKTLIEGSGIRVYRSTAVDPVTRHLYVAANSLEGAHFHVYEDVTAPFVATPPPDPDEGTHDIDEELASSVTYTGGASGYGTRARLVGGFGGGAFTLLSGDASGAFWNAAPPAIQALRPVQKDEGLTLADVSEVQVTATGASASATGLVLDESTEDDLRSRYSSFQNPLGSSEEPPDASNCDPASPSQDCLAFDAVAQNAPGWNESACRDLGNEGDPRKADQDGSSVTCTFAEEATAYATGSELMAGLPIQVARAESSAFSERDPMLGVVTTAQSVARGITVAAPGMGAVYIDEVRTEAKTWANGRPEREDGDEVVPGADSEFNVSINGVRIVDASTPPKTLFVCGYGNEGADDEDDKCDPAEVTREINERFAFRLQAEGPRRETANGATGSPRGAVSLVQKDLYAWWSDQNVNGDTRREVAGLTLTFYNDGDEASRLIVQLAGVQAQSQYRIGAEATETVLEPAKLVVELLDDLSQPLAGGMFEVHEDPTGGIAPAPPADEPAEGEDGGEEAEEPAEGEDGGEEAEEPAEGEGETEDPAEDEEEAGSSTTTTSSSTSTTVAPEDSEDAAEDLEETVDELLGGAIEIGDLIENGVCVTSDDGIGDCTFDDIEPGAYVVLQTAAPAGYAASTEPFPVPVVPGFETKVTFVNLRSIASIEITLTDDGDPPTPLEGGEFVLYSDDGNLTLNDADKEVGRCGTGTDGACGFPEVALGSYVVHQSVAPGGLMAADDVGFSLDLPGQVAALAFVNGLPPVEGTPTSSGGAGSVGGGSSGTVTITHPAPPPRPVVQRVPIRTGGGIFGLPSEAARFIARNPAEAALIGGVWLLFALPAYLAARRRSLVLLKETT